MAPSRQMIPDGQGFEEVLVWRRIRHYIEYVVFLNGERHRASDEDAAQADQAVQTMIKAEEDVREIKDPEFRKLKAAQTKIKVEDDIEEIDESEFKKPNAQRTIVKVEDSTKNVRKPHVGGSKHK